MAKRYAVLVALFVLVAMGGFFALAPTSQAQLPDGPFQKGTEETSPEPDSGGTVFISFDDGLGSLAGALKCHINCIEEPDITVEGDITIDDCISICESYCGGPCSAQ